MDDSRTKPAPSSDAAQERRAEAAAEEAPPPEDADLAVTPQPAAHDNGSARATEPEATATDATPDAEPVAAGEPATPGSEPELLVAEAEAEELEQGGDLGEADAPSEPPAAEAEVDEPTASLLQQEAAPATDRSPGAAPAPPASADESPPATPDDIREIEAALVEAEPLDAEPDEALAELPPAEAEPVHAEAVEPAPRSEPTPAPARSEAEPTPDRQKTKPEPSAIPSRRSRASTISPSSLRHTHGHGIPRGRYLFTLCLGALGVVYGDIGTSPLYAIRECFYGDHRVPVTPENVLGVLSLIFWSLTIIVTLKYLLYVLKADNRGEGGVLALMALALGGIKDRRAIGVAIGFGLFGAALLYGDGMITPAISVLSAVEGLEIATPAFAHLVVPITIVILILLFVPQRHGTAKVGAVFGPVMLVWFTTLAVLGIVHVVRNPSVLAALSPYHAAVFMIQNRLKGFLILGAVFLVVTGGEALYADMGHFGARPIRWTWMSFVLPALLINYFGQGALLLGDPSAAQNPFYLSAPRWALYPLLVLSTMATIIASQAVISGAFSLTRQAMMLGFWPRVEIQHTSSHEIGQIYVPTINWFLMLATIGLVLGFGSSSNMAAAYGIAVTTTMVITTLLAFQVARHRWGWSRLAAGSLTALFVVVDLSFFGANVVKIGHGGWFPLLVAGGVFVLMTTWKKGRDVLGNRIRGQIVPLSDFFEILRIERPARVPGAAVFMTSNAEGTPPALMQNFLHNRVVHQQVILLTVQTTEQPRVMPEERVRVERLEAGFVRVTAKYGFMEQPDIPALLEEKHIEDWSLEHTTFFLGRETLLAEGREGMARWRESVFAFMSRNSQRATTFFNIPSDRVMEIGSQIEL